MQMKAESTDAQAARSAMRRLRVFGRQALAEAERTGEEIEDLAAQPKRRTFPAFSAGLGVGTLMGALAAVALRKRGGRA